ncbi:type 2 lanthipeptide synthetase LanM family protein [Enterococcus rivorum]|uniref:type 2 lanthipeptide synthetase LanM family protein n=1 Tax=Enterococcus rivorum TaxID=762845 RepID=UPI00247FFDED|nr:type 2 lanthipeptide synthetase LanM family protein [Enterococcus rivorum]
MESETCDTETEISTYYYRFGEFTAICYFLCRNDFHAENIVANGSFPVLIDIETLLQNDNPLNELDFVFSIANLKKMQSVLPTSLLPAKYFSNRLEPKNGEKQDGLQMSAFNGKGQMLPFKVLQLINPGTDEVRFDYKEQWMEASNNLPAMLDREIKPEEYTGFLLRGFTDQYVFFMENKEKIIRKINDLFANVEVRNVLKATQQYLDMINYAYHPNCMMDYAEREKLFENLWGFNYKNKSVIAFEIDDLLVNDVPIFFNNASNKGIITSGGRIIKGYYNRTALGRIIERISSLNKADFDYQKVLLATSLGIYDGEECTCSLGVTPYTQLEKIVNIIVQRSVSDSKGNKSVFQDFLIDNGKREFGTLPVDFYDGSSGIYTFLLYYNEYYPNQKNKIFLDSLETILFERLPETFASFSVYQGSLSLLVPLYHRIRLFHMEKDKNRAFLIVQSLQKMQIDLIFQEDWLSGVAGLITVLVNLYTEATNREFLNFAQELAGKVTLETVKLCGLSRGYSGVAVALNKLNMLLPNKAYSQLISDCLTKERQYYTDGVWADLREGKNATAQWCHGCAGIGIARLELIQSGNEDILLKQELETCINTVLDTTLEKDSLCHGNLGNHAFLMKVLQTGIVSGVKEHKIRKKLVLIENKLLFDGVTVEGMSGYPLIGLMNGLSGIGYEWLRILTDYAIPDLLIFE